MILLLALGLGLAGAQRTLEEVPLQRDFDAQKVEGRWLTIGLATSNADLFSPDDPVRLSLHSIWTRDGGDMDFMLFWVGEGLCERLNFTVHPTALQGQYRGSFPGGGGALVRVVGTDYSSLILYARVEEGAAARSLWALLARRMFQDSQWLGQYLGYVRKFHLEKAPVFNVDGQCPLPSLFPSESQAWAAFLLRCPLLPSLACGQGLAQESSLPPPRNPEEAPRYAPLAPSFCQAEPLPSGTACQQLGPLACELGEHPGC